MVIAATKRQVLGSRPKVSYVTLQKQGASSLSLSRALSFILQVLTVLGNK